MDLTDLHIFRSVVQAGGVTRAAEKLNRVQSNVTTRVRQLESELGVELFVREGKKRNSIRSSKDRRLEGREKRIKNSLSLTVRLTRR